ncbi:lipoprotein [Lentilitoribacter sp. Alg239-R112]|uniref:LPS translocon maturation chaperone LptM n=1 Tax=Lentilitoribacter sp. Alg239-R112 TaxID=2305987 RepID=UPI0013A6A110|nr:lipoprotein [Lentilitoribacter sp. Alg239-R112]
MSRITLFVIALTSLMALSACGQKSPLVAPGDLDAKKTAPAPEETKTKSSGFLLD